MANQKFSSYFSIIYIYARVCVLCKMSGTCKDSSKNGKVDTRLGFLRTTNDNVVEMYQIKQKIIRRIKETDI